MKKFFGVACGGLVLCGSAMAQTTDLTVDPVAHYAPALQLPASLGNSCSWSADLVKRIQKDLKKQPAVVSETAGAGHHLVFSVAEMQATDAHEKRVIRAVIHADVLSAGKLIGSQAFSFEEKASASTSACDVFKDSASDFSSDIADWLLETRLPECQGSCAGIHPDEPIVMGSAIPVVEGEEINDSAVECGWAGYMPKTIVDAYNDPEEDKKARVPLTIAATPEAPATGRRLVMQTEGVRTAGGGAYSGPKWVKITGKLYDGEILAGSFKLSKTTILGSLGGCKTLTNLSKDAASAIAEWIKQPGMDSEL